MAVVTGAAGGIGAAVTAGLLAAGAAVAALDADEPGLKALAEAGPPRSPDRLLALATDVRDADGVERALDLAEKQLGPVDLLVNVAGVLRMAPVVELADEDWATVIGINVGGVFTVSRAVARRMMQRRRGAVVTVASNAARVPRIGMGAYAASKAATAMLTKCLGLELAGHGIRCNVVDPGSTLTRMQRDMWTDELGAQAVVTGSLENFRTGIPAGRIADPQDVADAVLFLLSDRSRHITMHELVVDGGAALGA